jgi:hypothetical protein
LFIVLAYASVLQGWDKTYCLQFVEKDYDEIHFFGDKTFPVSTSAYTDSCYSLERSISFDPFSKGCGGAHAPAYHAYSFCYVNKPPGARMCLQNIYCLQELMHCAGAAHA